MTNPRYDRPRHPTRRITPPPIAAWMAIATVMAMAVAGCEKEPVRSYTVGKSVATAGALPAGHPDIGGDVGGEGVRLLGAVLPAGDRTWYVKFVADVHEVADHAEEFDAFVRSTTLPGADGEPIGWTDVPASWRRQAGSGFRYATFVIGNHQPPLEVTVSPLGPESGSVKLNVDRWRGQIGLADSTNEELAATTRRVKIAGVDATLVDLAGPGVGGGAVGPHVPRAPSEPSIPPFLRRPSEQEEPATLPTPTPEAAGAVDATGPITVTLPAGWTKLDKAPTMALVGYVVEQGGVKLVTSVSRFGGDAGGVDANIKRWAGQIGLGADHVVPTAKLSVDGATATYASLIPPSGEGDAILGAIIPRGDATWFIKLRGPAGAVKAQDASFMSLIQSIRFKPSAGDEK